MLNIIAPNRPSEPWVKAIKSLDPSIELTVWPELNKLTKMVLCWQPPSDVWQSFENLQCICSMGAGVDGLVDNEEIPRHIPIVRLVDINLKQDMYYYIRHCIESHRLKQHDYRRAQRNKDWSPKTHLSQADMSVSILGFGEIGQFVAEQLITEGFKVSAWKQTPAQHSQVKLYNGQDGLSAMLSQTQILICLLPLTAQTTGILNKTLFEMLPTQSVLIQVGRGPQLNETDLLWALNNGRISEAYLDVFVKEPLPEEHPFWLHPDVYVTPHNASITRPESVATQVVANYHNLVSNKPLSNEVSRQRGY